MLKVRVCSPVICVMAAGTAVAAPDQPQPDMRTSFELQRQADRHNQRLRIRYCAERFVSRFDSSISPSPLHLTNPERNI